MVLFARPRPGSGLNPEEAADLARVALRTKFKIRPGANDKFDTVTPDSIKEFIGRILGVIGAAVVPITCISLVVGGIVIMNIMLVSVTERTSEIGLRRALGAHDSDILLQFLVEALVLCAIGGVIGIAISFAVSQALASVPAVSFRIVIELWAVGLALIVSTASGFVFGLYPAMRATKLDPIEALRYE